MAPYSSTLAWRHPGTGEPGGVFISLDIYRVELLVSLLVKGHTHLPQRPGVRMLSGPCLWTCLMSGEACALGFKLPQ